MSLRNTIRAIGFAVLLLSCSAVALAQRWAYLGEANVDGAADHDNIVVTGSRGAFRAIMIRVQKAPIEFDRRWYNQFCRRAWRGRAQIGHEIGDGEIDFMSNCGNNRDRRGCDRAGDNFLIKLPQILDTAATARDDN